MIARGWKFTWGAWHYVTGRTSRCLRADVVLAGPPRGLPRRPWFATLDDAKPHARAPVCPDCRALQAVDPFGAESLG